MATPTPLHQLNTKALQSNLNYICSREHEVLALLENAAQSEPIEVLPHANAVRCKVAGPQGQWLFGERDPVAERQAIQQRLQAIPPETKLVLLFGSAGANALVPLLQRIMNDPGFHVVVIEPSAARIQLILALVECWPVLATERLHMIVSAMGKDEVLESLKPLNLASVNPVAVMVSPEMDRAINGPAVQQAWSEDASAQQQSRATISFRATEPAEVPHKVKRVLLINAWQHVAGGVHIDAIENVLRSHGCVIETLYVSRHRLEASLEGYRRLVEQRFLQKMSTFEPDLVLSYGYHAPHCYREDLADAIQVPWVQIVSNLAYYDEFQYPNERTFIAEPNMISIFERRGYERLAFLPLMADYHAPEPVTPDGRFPLVFVGNSMSTSEADDAEFMKQWVGRDAVVKTIHEAVSDLSRFDNQHTFYEWNQPERFPDVESEKERHSIFRYLLCKSGCARRRQVLERLAPHGLTLFGGDWDGLLPQDSPLRACLKGYLPLQQEREIFKHGTIFLNIHSIGCVDSANMRFFNVPAMGSFQISDNPRFTKFMTQNEEMIYVTSVDEYAEKVEYYLQHEAERNELRYAAWERVSKDWTYRNWVEQIADACEITFG